MNDEKLTKKEKVLNNGIDLFLTAEKLNHKKSINGWDWTVVAFKTGIFLVNLNEAFPPRINHGFLPPEVLSYISAMIAHPLYANHFTFDFTWPDGTVRRYTVKAGVRTH